MWRRSCLLVAAVVLVFALAAVLAGCGGNASTPSTPTAGSGSGSGGSGSPPTGGSGSGGSGSGGSGSGGSGSGGSGSGGSGSGGSGGSGSGSGSAVSPTTYTASLLSFSGGIDTPATRVGSVTVNDGQVTYQISGWQANLTVPIDFCSYPVSRPDQCFSMNATATTDAMGAASGSFHFPKSGTFSGWFRFGPSAPSLSSGFTPSFAGGAQYSAAIVKMPDPQQPFGSGSVTVSNAGIHIEVSGAPASATYQVFESFSVNGEDQIGTLMTDASGNGTVDLTAAHGRGLIVLRRVNGGDVSSGFVVP